MTQLENRPLAGLRVLDLTLGDAALIARILADLGADVLKIEPPGGRPARGRAPLICGVGVEFALHNANKRCARPYSHGEDAQTGCSSACSELPHLSPSRSAAAQTHGDPSVRVREPDAREFASLR